MPTKPTAGELLADGTLLEVVCVAEAPGLRLLLWNGREARFVPSSIYGQIRYTPIDSPASVLAAVNFPTSILEFASLRALVDEISSLVARMGHVASNDTELLALFIISTWFADVLPAAPFLWLVASNTVPRRRLVRLLELLCRRSLRVGEFSFHTLESIPDGLEPTLIAEVDGMSRSRSLLRAVRASGRRGVLTAVNGKMRDLHCGKIIIAGEPFDRSTATEFPLEIALGPTANSGVEPAEMERAAALLQQKLLKLRLERRAEVALSNPNCDAFAAPLQTAVLTLAAPVWTDEYLRSRLVSLFAEVDRELRAESAVRLDALVVEALLAGCHTRGLRQLPVLEIAKNVNTMREGREGGTEISPEKIGWILRGLGIPAISLPDGRRGLEVDNAMGCRIHALAAQLQTRSWMQRANQAGCSFCAAQLQTGAVPGPDVAGTEKRI